MGLMEVANGKLKYIFGGIPIAFVIVLALRYGGVEKQVEVNSKDIVIVNKDIVTVKKKANKIDVVESKVNLMMTEQQVIKKDIKEILKAVK